MCHGGSCVPARPCTYSWSRKRAAQEAGHLARHVIFIVRAWRVTGSTLATSPDGWLALGCKFARGRARGRST